MPTTNFAGEESLNNRRFQIDVFAAGKATTITLAASVRVAMNAATSFKSLCVDERDNFEDAVQLYRRSLDFSVWQ